VLVKLGDVRCKNSAETMMAALTGNYKSEHFFALKLSLDLYDIYNEKAESCDQEIQVLLNRKQQDITLPEQSLPKANHARSIRTLPISMFVKPRSTLSALISRKSRAVTIPSAKLVSEC